MKLNKVLALALSGVMAVSMLAGCSGAPGWLLWRSCEW